MTMAQENIIPMARAIPASETSERSAISCLLQNFNLLNATTWPEELFLNPRHRTILSAIKELHAEGTKTDFFAVQSLLEGANLLDSVGGHHGLTDILTVMPTGDPGIAEWHRKTLVDAARYRRALATVREAEEGLIRQEADIAALSLALAETAALADKPRASTSELIGKLTEELERREPAEAFGTGIPALDRATTGGVKRGELLTIAAPTSGGKSILLAQLALHSLLAGKRVVFFSLEMSATQVIARLLSSMCGFNIHALRASKPDPKAAHLLPQFISAATKLSKLPLQVESGFTDIESIDSSTRELHAKGKCDLAIVDYIQLVHLRALGANETREQHVSEITKRLKALALQLNIATATASQLNDEGKLRESRAIGHHSDHVWLISHTDESAWIAVEKNRDGERGLFIPATMRGATSQFVELTQKTPTP